MGNYDQKQFMFCLACQALYRCFIYKNSKYSAALKKAWFCFKNVNACFQLPNLDQKFSSSLAPESRG